MGIQSELARAREALFLYKRSHPVWIAPTTYEEARNLPGLGPVALKALVDAGYIAPALNADIAHLPKLLRQGWHDLRVWLAKHRGGTCQSLMRTHQPRSSFSDRQSSKHLLRPAMSPARRISLPSCASISRGIASCASLQLCQILAFHP